jgi:hypothetical protein
MILGFAWRACFLVPIDGEGFGKSDPCICIVQRRSGVRIDKTLTRLKHQLCFVPRYLAKIMFERSSSRSLHAVDCTHIQRLLEMRAYGCPCTSHPLFEYAWKWEQNLVKTHTYLTMSRRLEAIPSEFDHVSKLHAIEITLVFPKLLAILYISSLLHVVNYTTPILTLSALEGDGKE